MPGLFPVSGESEEHALNAALSQTTEDMLSPYAPGTGIPRPSPGQSSRSLGVSHSPRHSPGTVSFSAPALGGELDSQLGGFQGWASPSLGSGVGSGEGTLQLKGGVSSTSFALSAVSSADHLTEGFVQVTFEWAF